MNIALRRFLHNHGNIATEGSRDYALLLFRMTSRVLYSAQYHRQHCTLHAFEQFGALYMHNHDDKYPSRPVFEPGTPRLQAPVDTNEPSGPTDIQGYIDRNIFCSERYTTVSAYFIGMTLLLFEINKAVSDFLITEPPMQTAVTA